MHYVPVLWSPLTLSSDVFSWKKLSFLTKLPNGTKMVVSQHVLVSPVSMCLGAGAATVLVSTLLRYAFV